MGMSMVTFWDHQKHRLGYLNILKNALNFANWCFISPLACPGNQVVNDQGVCACPDGQVDDGQGNDNCIGK